MARERSAGKPTTYLGINSEGNLYSSFREEKEGYEKFVSKSTGAVSYRKTFTGTEYGKITDLGVIEKTFESGKAKYLHITVEGESGRDVIQLPFKTIKGGLSDIVKKFIAVLPGVDFKRDLTITSNTKKNDRGYVDRVLFVTYVTNGEQEDKALGFTLKFGKDGDIPGFEKVEGLDGIEYDYKAQDLYLYNKLIDQLERFEAEKVSVSTSSIETGEKAAEPITAKQGSIKGDKAVEPKLANEPTPNTRPDQDDDDLPF